MRRRIGPAIAGLSFLHTYLILDVFQINDLVGGFFKII